MISRRASWSVDAELGLHRLFLAAHAQQDGLLQWDGDCAVFFKLAHIHTEDIKGLGHEAAINAGSMRFTFQSIANRAGLLSPVTPHSIRRGAARDVAEVPRQGVPGLNVEAAANLMGHAPTSIRGHLTEDVYISKRREAIDDQANPAPALESELGDVRDGSVRVTALASRAKHAVDASFRLPFAEALYDGPGVMTQAEVEAAFAGVPSDSSVTGGRLVAGVVRSKKEQQRVRTKRRKHHWLAFVENARVAADPNPASTIVRRDMVSTVRMPGSGSDAIKYAEHVSSRAAGAEEELAEDDTDDKEEQAGASSLNEALCSGGELTEQHFENLHTDLSADDYVNFFKGINTLWCGSLNDFFQHETLLLTRANVKDSSRW